MVPLCRTIFGQAIGAGKSLKLKVWCGVLLSVMILTVEEALSKKLLPPATMMQETFSREEKHEMQNVI